MKQRIKIIESHLCDNSERASACRLMFQQAGVLVVNLIGGPGSGKTRLLIKTLEALSKRFTMAVIVGDVRGFNDAGELLSAGAHDVVRINTGQKSYLEADLISQAIEFLNIDELDIIFIENVGNLIDPLAHDLGQHKQVALFSTSEGENQANKYPFVVAQSDAIILNKIDLVEVLEFDTMSYYTAVTTINPAVYAFDVSSKTGQGLERWTAWLSSQCESMQKNTSTSIKPLKQPSQRQPNV